MAVIPESQWQLARARQALAKALTEQDWGKIQQCDLALMAALDTASEDPQRDAKALLRELESVVRLYQDLVLSSETHSRYLNGAH